MTYNWIRHVPATQPPGRFEYMLCWDGEHVLMYGGVQNSPVPTLLDDTWIWDGTDWTELSPAHSPGLRSIAGIAYDIANDRVVLFGGDDGVGVSSETWVWDRTDWTQLTPATTPPARSFTHMAYDETRSKVVMFSGSDIGGALIEDTWTWNGTDWTLETPANDPFDYGHANQNLSALAWDPTNHLVVFHPSSLVGGVNGTWTWDGTNWTEHVTTHHVSAVELPGFALWRVGGQAISFGGRTGGLPDVPTEQTRTWDGTDWTIVIPATSPNFRADIMLAYDETRREVVLFGGLIAGFPQLEDTWVYADTGRYTLHLETGSR